MNAPFVVPTRSWIVVIVRVASEVPG
jgi:hypothetical protein